MRYHVDDRRAFWGDIFGFPNGDLNVVKLRPGVIVAWHRHDRQDDRICIIDGSVHIQAIDETGERMKWFLSAPDEETVKIPRRWWHGYTSRTGAILVQFNGPGKWDGTDEQRMSLTEMPWIPTS